MQAAEGKVCIDGVVSGKAYMLILREDAMRNSPSAVLAYDTTWSAHTAPQTRQLDEQKQVELEEAVPNHPQESAMHRQQQQRDVWIHRKALQRDLQLMTMPILS